MLTRSQLHQYAQEQDGCCKVQIDDHGAVRLYPPDRELGMDSWHHWDYYFTDESESFDFKRFGL